MRKKGFSLTELLVVMSIIGILMSIALIGIKSSRERANISKAKADISQIALAVTLVYSDTRLYPGNYTTISSGSGRYQVEVAAAGLVSCGSPFSVDTCASWNGPYYKGPASDPWGRGYSFDYNYIDPRGVKSHVAISSDGKTDTTKCDDLFKSLKDNGGTFPTPNVCLNFKGQVDE